MRQNPEDPEAFTIVGTGHERSIPDGSNNYWWDHIILANYEVDSSGDLSPTALIAARYGDGDSGEQNDPAVEAGFLITYENNNNESRLLLGGSSIHQEVISTRNLIWYVDDPETMLNGFNTPINMNEILEDGIQDLSNPLTEFDYGTCDAALIGYPDFLVFGTYVSDMPPVYRPCVFKESIPAEIALPTVFSNCSGDYVPRRALIVSPMFDDLQARVFLAGENLAQLKVFDCTGRQVFSSMINQEAVVKFNQPGVYFMQVEYEDGRIEFSKCVVIR